MNNSAPTQAEMVLRTLEDGLCLTPWQAMKDYGIMRLAARINELRRHGYNIGSRWKKSTNRFGGKVQFKEYFMEVDL